MEFSRFRSLYLCIVVLETLIEMAPARHYEAEALKYQQLPVAIAAQSSAHDVVHFMHSDGDTALSQAHSGLNAAYHDRNKFMASIT